MKQKPNTGVLGQLQQRLSSSDCCFKLGAPGDHVTLEVDVVGPFSERPVIITLASEDGRYVLEMGTAETRQLAAHLQKIVGDEDWDGDEADEPAKPDPLQEVYQQAMADAFTAKPTPRTNETDRMEELLRACTTGGALDPQTLFALNLMQNLELRLHVLREAAVMLVNAFDREPSQDMKIQEIDQKERRLARSFITGIVPNEYWDVLLPNEAATPYPAATPEPASSTTTLERHLDKHGYEWRIVRDGDRYWHPAHKRWFYAGSSCAFVRDAAFAWCGGQAFGSPPPDNDGKPPEAFISAVARDSASVEGKQR